MDAKKLLVVSKLTKSFSNRKVVHNFSLTIGSGEVVGLLGPNGAGKTTAFYMIMGLIRPDVGSIFFDGVDISERPIHARAKLGMGYLAQEPSIFPDLTVEENLLSILEMLPISKAERLARMRALLEELHLTPLAKKRACTLSGGERRRLEITRVLILEPKLLLLDEPFASVDPITISELQKMIRILSMRGISILITDHNAREIFSVVDRCYLMRAGTSLLSGAVDELIAHPEARESYLGNDFRL